MEESSFRERSTSVVFLIFISNNVCLILRHNFLTRTADGDGFLVSTLQTLCWELASGTHGGIKTGSKDGKYSSSPHTQEVQFQSKVILLVNTFYKVSKALHYQ